MDNEHIKLAVIIKADKNKVKHALTTKNDIQKWNTSNVSLQDNILKLKYSNNIEFDWEIHESNDDIIWKCVNGPKNAKNKEAIYSLEEIDNQTKVSLIHNNWELNDDEMSFCFARWGALLFSLKNYLEFNKPNLLF